MDEGDRTEAHASDGGPGYRSVVRQRTFTVALLPWGDLIEDFLDAIGLSLEAFCREMSGGWLFGYIEALQSADIRTVVFCVSGRVSAPTRMTNAPTGARFCVLPATRTYMRLRHRMRDPYGRTAHEMFGTTRTGRLFLPAVKSVAPYLSTPLPLLMRELRRERCRAILCQEYEYARFDVCVMAGMLLRLPVFATFQGGDRHRSRLEGIVRPYTIKSCSGLIIASESEIRRVGARYGVEQKKISRIVNPLNPSVWRAVDRTRARAEVGIPEAARVVVWHGRVDIHRKGLDVLLEAWTYVHEALSSGATLLLVGTGQDSDELTRRIGAMPEASIRWVNQYILDRARIIRFLSAADVYVLPSRHEGFPVAPIEAMACGLPVVAADAPGMPEILGDREAPCGRMVSRGDALALAQALGELLADRSLARLMGSRARRRVQTAFSTAVVGEQLKRMMTSTAES